MQEGRVVVAPVGRHINAACRFPPLVLMHQKGESGQRPLITVMLFLLMKPKASSRTQPEADSRKPIAFGSACSDFFPPTGIYWLSLTYDSYQDSSLRSE
jgi:hypothetical protein